MNDALRLDRIADAANRAMASFYTIYARGLAAEQTPNGAPPAAIENEERDPASRMDAMRQLSGNTDGIAVTTSHRARCGGDAHRCRHERLRSAWLSLDECEA